VLYLGTNEAVRISRALEKNLEFDLLFRCLNTESVTKLLRGKVVMLARISQSTSNFTAEKLYHMRQCPVFLMVIAHPPYYVYRDR
jgi:hypothetical protein